MTDERIEVWVRTRDMTIDVAREFRTSIQSLEPHPDIVIVRRGEPIDEPVDEAPQLVPVDVIVHMNAEEPFWVRREDFGVQLVSKLDIRSTGTDVRVGGYVEFRRGWLELLGKRFELEEGRVEFLGGSELDPRIDILMSHELETGGAQLFVRVLGHLQKPELQFSSTIPGVTTAGGVLALLAGGDRGTEGQGATESAAAQQATSFLAGVTAGMLTLTARREIGDVFPDISLEATDTGARLRAAFDADWLIPGFLEGIVRGMYIEGFVGTGGGDGAGAGQEGVRDTSGASGVGIELLFPHDLVGTAEIQPPASWSADLMYEP
jgi:translocation and assembly module TamB